MAKRQTAFRLSSQTIAMLEAGKGIIGNDRTAVLQAWIQLGYRVMLAEQKNGVNTPQSTGVIHEE